MKSRERVILEDLHEFIVARIPVHFAISGKAIINSHLRIFIEHGSIIFSLRGNKRFAHIPLADPGYLEKSAQVVRKAVLLTIRAMINKSYGYQIADRIKLELDETINLPTIFELPL